MLKRIAFIVMAVAVGLATQSEAGIFGNRGGGGCPNGQCNVQTYYPSQKVAQPVQAPKAGAAVATVQSAAPAVQTTPYVASQSSRRGFFRRSR